MKSAPLLIRKWFYPDSLVARQKPKKPYLHDTFMTLPWHHSKRARDWYVREKNAIHVLQLLSPLRKYSESRLMLKVCDRKVIKIVSEINTRFSGNDNSENKQTIEPTHIGAEAHQLLAEKNISCNSASASEHLPGCDIYGTTNNNAVDKHTDSKSSSHADESACKSLENAKHSAGEHGHQSSAKESSQTGAAGSSTADDPAALLRKQRLEITQALKLPPDASSEQITAAQKALGLGLSTDATQAEISQYENDKQSQT